MTENTALLLILVVALAAIVAIRFGLAALGASHEQIAAAWTVCIGITGLVGGFVFSEYSRSNKRR
jgi:general stress protein CsbA